MIDLFRSTFKFSKNIPRVSKLKGKSDQASRKTNKTLETFFTSFGSVSSKSKSPQKEREFQLFSKQGIIEKCSRSKNAPKYYQAKQTFEFSQTQISPNSTKAIR
jgi:hypothetical protein